METNEWFACLGYRTVDLLIPQDAIFESLYSGSDTLAGMGSAFGREFRIDDFVAQVFHEQCLGAGITTLVIKCDEPLLVKSAIVPGVIRLERKSFHEAGGILGGRLRGAGFLACRFEQERIQYLIDIQQVYDKWRQV